MLQKDKRTTFWGSFLSLYLKVGKEKGTKKKKKKAYKIIGRAAPVGGGLHVENNFSWSKNSLRNNRSEKWAQDLFKQEQREWKPQALPYNTSVGHRNIWPEFPA